ncbi:hypothetical protein D6779_11950 [Candidatus Parcubacteria bacterium]|nr:MAG: hypothetical protein D6779_11950 [Candidatus Parcubacteria bacterium]
MQDTLYSLPQVSLTSAQLVAAVSPWYLALAFALVLALFVFFTIVLRYHWKHYALNPRAAKLASRIYMTGSAILLVAAVVVFVLYSI